MPLPSGPAFTSGGQRGPLRCLRALISATALLTALTALSGCSGTSSPGDAAADADASDGASSALHWYKTCGAPLCPAADAGVSSDGGAAACTVEKAGDACAQAGATCDPGLGCGVLLLCAEKDPRTQPGGCPISRRAYKTEISYLDAAALDGLMDELRTLRLATYRYRDAPERVHLGFMIDDAPKNVAVDEPRDQIDLYSYISLAVGALQSQAGRLEAQDRELAALRLRVDALAPRRRSGAVHHGQVVQPIPAAGTGTASR